LKLKHGTLKRMKKVGEAKQSGGKEIWGKNARTERKGEKARGKEGNTENEE
jgi:hypothetical protein